jgi:hypothetical protein
MKKLKYIASEVKDYYVRVWNTNIVARCAFIAIGLVGVSILVSITFKACK